MPLVDEALDAVVVAVTEGTLTGARMANAVATGSWIFAAGTVLSGGVRDRLLDLDLLRRDLSFDLFLSLDLDLRRSRLRSRRLEYTFM